MPTHAFCHDLLLPSRLDSVLDENFRDWVSSQFFSLKTYVRCFGVGWKASLPHDP